MESSNTQPAADSAVPSATLTDRCRESLAPASSRARWWYRFLPRWFEARITPKLSEAPNADSVAIGGVVRLLCDVRLLALVACGFEMIIESTGTNDPRLWLLLALLPFSYVPLRSWTTRGGLFTRSTILARCDIVLTVVTVMFCLDIQSVGLYAATGVAMVGVIHGTRWALVAAPPIAAIQLAGMIVLGLYSITSMVPLLPIVTLVMAGCGGRLGTALREQASARRAARHADARAVAAEERLRLARNLHDTVVGEIAGVQWMVIQLHEIAVDGDPEQRMRLVEAIKAACAVAYTDSRLMLNELRAEAFEPEIPRGSDLPSRIDSWGQLHDIDVSYDIAVETYLCSTQLRIDTQAIISELLENVRRHAFASKISVRTRVEENQGLEIVIEVADNGMGFPGGFDKNRVAHDGQPHYGLRGIEERVASHGGLLKIETVDPHGALVTVRLHELVPSPEAAIASPKVGRKITL